MIETERTRVALANKTESNWAPMSVVENQSEGASIDTFDGTTDSFTDETLSHRGTMTDFRTKVNDLRAVADEDDWMGDVVEWGKYERDKMTDPQHKRFVT